MSKSLLFPQAPKGCRDILMQSWPDIFPGIERVVLVYANSNGEMLGEELLLVDRQYKQRTLIPKGWSLKDGSKSDLQLGYSWLHINQLPFENSRTSVGQLEIFSENQHVVLHLKLKHQFEIDQYFLFFREDQSNFGVSRIQGELDTGRKALIGSIVYRFGRTLYQNTLLNQGFINEFTDVVKRVVACSRAGNGSDNTEKKEWISAWANDLLDEISVQYTTQLRLSNDALDKLLGVNDFKQMKAALTRAVQFALMLHVNEMPSDLWIQPEYIGFDVQAKAPDNRLPNVQPTSRLAKTKLFLDHLETAANGLYERGEDLTGVAVGQALQRPISAPAISDALRKNQERIIRLLNQYPDHWPLIRQQFRPLVNLVEKSTHMRNVG